MKFWVSIDDVCEDIFHELESISGGRNGHECVVEADSDEKAAEIIIERLKPFFAKKLERYDDQ